MTSVLFSEEFIVNTLLFVLIVIWLYEHSITTFCKSLLSVFTISCGHYLERLAECSSVIS